MKFVSEQIFHPTFSCLQHQKYMLDSFKVVYYPIFNFQHHFECDSNVFEQWNVYSNVFIKNNKKLIMIVFHWFFYSMKWGQKFGLIRTHRQWHSYGTYLGNPFGLQPLTPELWFWSSHFLSSFLSILLFFLDEVIHHLNWEALLRPSQVNPCKRPFWK